MRNDIKPAVPPRETSHAGDAQPPHDDPRATAGSPSGADYDREHGSDIRRERGDAADPAGPKPSQVYGALGSGGAVTDPSGTTGPVSRSGDRMSTTTGHLGDRDLERSARQGEAPDVNVYPISTGDSSFSVPTLMVALVILMAIIGAILFLSWPDGSAATNADTDETAAEVVGE